MMRVRPRRGTEARMRMVRIPAKLSLSLQVSLAQIESRSIWGTHRKTHRNFLFHQSLAKYKRFCAGIRCLPICSPRTATYVSEFHSPGVLLRMVISWSWSPSMSALRRVSHRRGRATCRRRPNGLGRHLAVHWASPGGRDLGHGLGGQGRRGRPTACATRRTANRPTGRAADRLRDRRRRVGPRFGRRGRRRRGDLPRGRRRRRRVERRLGRGAPVRSRRRRLLLWRLMR